MQVQYPGVSPNKERGYQMNGSPFLCLVEAGVRMVRYIMGTESGAIRLIWSLESSTHKLTQRVKGSGQRVLRLGAKPL